MMEVHPRLCGCVTGVRQTQAASGQHAGVGPVVGDSATMHEVVACMSRPPELK